MISSELVNFKQAIMVYRSMNNLAPTYVGQLFQHTKEIHNRSLRSTIEDWLYVPKPNCESLQKPLNNSKTVISNGHVLHKHNVSKIYCFSYVVWININALYDTKHFQFSNYYY